MKTEQIIEALLSEGSSLDRVTAMGSEMSDSFRNVATAAKQLGSRKPDATVVAALNVLNGQLSDYHRFKDALDDVHIALLNQLR